MHLLLIITYSNSLLRVNFNAFPLSRALPLDDIPDLIPKLSHLNLSSSVMSQELERFHLVTSSPSDSNVESQQTTTTTTTTQLESAEDFLQWMQREVEVEMVANGDSRLNAFRSFLDKREHECGECYNRCCFLAYHS